MQVNLAMDAISECCKTGQGNLLDLAVKVQRQITFVVINLSYSPSK